LFTQAQVDSGESAKQMLTVIEQIRQSNEESARKNVQIVRSKFIVVV